jgi:hypothetical protein
VPLAEVGFTGSMFKIVDHLHAEGPGVDDCNRRIGLKQRTVCGWNAIDLPQQRMPLDFIGWRRCNDMIGRLFDGTCEHEGQVIQIDPQFGG